MLSGGGGEAEIRMGGVAQDVCVCVCWCVGVWFLISDCYILKVAGRD